MASAIKPLKQWKKTAWRKKYLTQSQRWGKVTVTKMIDRPPEYELTCYCGMKITGTNENGVVSLLNRHTESGIFHTNYLQTLGWAHKQKMEMDEMDLLDNILGGVIEMRKGIRNASTTR
jgi:hypothetical protein